MARILYGIHGTGHGHAMRGLTLARALPQHEFLFIANDDAPRVLEPEFRVARLPNLGTVFKNYQVDLAATIRRAAPILLQRKRHIRTLLRLIDQFQPDVCMTDLEYFTPQAAKLAGLPCLTLDHQHVITCCRHELPPNMRWDAFLQGLTPRWLFSPTEANLIVSFYAPPVLPGYNALIVPPILREKVIGKKSEDTGHILVYQSNSTDKRLLEVLKALGKKSYIFGYGDCSGQDGNLIFRQRNEDEFLDLLAGCSYVVQGGSHTLMSEALYLNKPVLSLPIKAMVEQRFNALYLERLGYGRQVGMDELTPTFMERFDAEVESFRKAQLNANFLGNSLVFNIVDNYARTGKIPGLA